MLRRFRASIGRRQAVKLVAILGVVAAVLAATRVAAAGTASPDQTAAAPAPAQSAGGAFDFQPGGQQGVTGFRCTQMRDGPTLAGGIVVGSAHTNCGMPVTEMQILVELYRDGLAVGTFGHDKDFGEPLVQAWAQADCFPGIWTVVASTYIQAPPGYVPPEAYLYTPAEDLVRKVINAKDCLPVLLNMNEGDARNKLAALGLNVGTVTHQPNSAPANSVLSWSLRSDNVTVDLVESLGEVTVPKLVGTDLPHASQFLSTAGLNMGGTTWRNYDDIGNGIVAAQSPAAGTRVSPGSTVNIVVSVGPASGQGGGGDDGGGGGGGDGGGCFRTC